MEKITYTEFIRALEQYGTAVHCELYANNYTRYYSDENPGDAAYYSDRGCVIRADDYEYDGKRRIWRNVHQISPDAELDAVAAEQLADAKEYAKAFENVSLNVIAFTVSNGDLPPEKDRRGGWRNYVRMGAPVPKDARVRILTADDAELIRAACAPSLAEDGDTRAGWQLAQNFSEYDFEHADGTLYGIFVDGKLAGMASSSCEKGINLAWLRDIYVAPQYRQQGLGKALVLTALADYPALKWHYQVAKWNAPSIALAKSLGFTLEGAGLYLE